MFLITIIIALVGLVLYTVTYIINKNEYEKARKKRIKSPHSEVNTPLFRVDSDNNKKSSNKHAHYTGIVFQNTS
jgi:predicted membrane protein